MDLVDEELMIESKYSTPEADEPSRATNPPLLMSHVTETVTGASHTDTVSHMEHRVHLNPVERPKPEGTTTD